VQLLQRPDSITMLYDEDHEVRRVRMNQPHPAQVTPSWYGDSVGHYESDTLVIDTVGFKIGPFSAVDCRSIINAHGGRLWADVNASRGAVFRFTLPPDSRAARRHHGVVAPGPPSLRTQRVNPKALSLTRDGLVCLKAHSGEEALEILLVHTVALALLDVQMPGMDGFQLAEFMRGSERARHIPIIFVTAGSADNRRRFRSYEAGAQAEEIRERMERQAFHLSRLIEDLTDIPRIGQGKISL
jgi:CheY-like chemotaxis protein